MVAKKLFVLVLGVALVSLLPLTGCASVEEKPSVTLEDAPAVSSSTTVAQTPSSAPARVSPPAPATTPPPSSSATPSPTPRPDASNPLLAMVDSSGDVVLVGYDGSNKKKLVDGSECPKPTKLIWSPTGDKLACLSYEHVETMYEQNRAWSLSRYTVVIADVEGRVLGKIGPLESFTWSFAWSPTGQHLAYGVVVTTTPDPARGLGTPMETYYVADYTGKTIAQLQGGERWLGNDLVQGIQGNLIWSPDGSVLAYNADSGEVATYNLNTKSKIELGEGAERPLAWVLGGKALLVASKYDPEAMLPRYEANLLDLAAGQLRRVPELDDSNRFWLSPNGNRVAFLYRDGPRQIFAGLAMLDFATLAVTPIPDSIIRYGSETIPYENAAFSPDGTSLYWADMADGTHIYRARSNGTELTKLVSLPITVVAFAPDLSKMVYLSFGNPQTLLVSDPDGSGAVEIGPRFPFAWRPNPTAEGSSSGETHTPAAQASGHFSFDTVRITAEQEVSDDHWGLYPVWSPDGSKLAFTKLPEWTRKFGGFDWSPWSDLWIAEGDGSNPRLLVPNGSGLTFSRDGQWLYYSASEPDETYRAEGDGPFTRTATYRIRLDGAEKAQLYADSENRGAAVAPCALQDGRLAILTGQRSILFLDAYTRRILDTLPDLTGVWRFWCSPDGKQIVYQLGDRLWIGPIDGSSRRLLANVSGEEPQPISWSANGQSMVYTAVYELWIAAADGSSPKKVADVSAFPEPKAGNPLQSYIGSPILSPDGQLAFVSFSPGLRDSRSSTYVVDISTGQVRLFAENKMLVSLSADGTRGIFTYGRQASNNRWQRPLVAANISP